MLANQAKVGFTLVELLVVVLLLAIVAAVAIPQYNRAVENSRADDALAIVQMIATTNRMYAVDFNRYTSGAIGNDCNAAACAGAGNVSPPGCDLVACNMLGKQDWNSKLYSFQALSAAPTSHACGLDFPSADFLVACTRRIAGGPAVSSQWGYAISKDGKVYASVSSCSGCRSTPEPAN